MQELDRDSNKQQKSGDNHEKEVVFWIWKQTLIFEHCIAPKHIAHGSQDAYISQSDRSSRLSVMHAWKIDPVEDIWSGW